MGDILSVEKVSKAFGSNIVLRDVDFSVRPGEVHTLMGENGAGKSTLMRIIAGLYSPDSGTLRLGGSPLNLRSAHEAIQNGIVLIHQEPQNFPDVTIAENIFLGRTVPSRGGLIDWKSLNSHAAEVLRKLGTKLQPTQSMRDLSPAEQQMVELAAALTQEVKLLLMDEPTASLTPAEVSELFRVVNQLKSQGVGIVFISHRLPEVFEQSDRISVLRDGEIVGCYETAGATQDQIVAAMVGRELELTNHVNRGIPGDPVLEVKNLCVPAVCDDVSFHVRKGEIVALTGLVGAGRTELAEAIFGVRTKTSGQVVINSFQVDLRHPADAISHGLAYVPEDRAHHGLHLPLSIANNLSIVGLPAMWLRPKQEAEAVSTWKERLSIRMQGGGQTVGELSGGNQQKVVLGKWLNKKPKVLIVDELTRGVDIGARAQVHDHLWSLAQEGLGILMISSDLPEVLSLADRVLVMRNGRIVAEHLSKGLTQEKVMADAAGVGIKDAKAATNKQTPFALKYREVVTFALIALIVILSAAVNPRMISPDSLRTVLLFIPVILAVAIGQMMVIVCRHIDLSVGSTLGVAAMVAGRYLADHPSTPLPVAFALATMVGMAAGCLNGVLVAVLNVPSIVATLGTLTAFRGVVHILAAGKQIDPSQLPQSLSDLASVPLLGLAPIVWLSIGLAVVGGLWQRNTVSGRFVFAVGSNPNAARMRGLPDKRTVFTTFVITGALAGFAGMIFGARYGTINPSSVGNQLELLTISAVVLGGTSVSGGSGSMLGTVLGAVMIAIINVALSVLQIGELWQNVVYGIVIVTAASTDLALRRRSVSGGRK